MFEVPLEGITDMLRDNEAVFKKTSTPESVLRKKHHRITYHNCREAVAALIFRIGKKYSETNLADLFTKILGLTIREWLLKLFTY